MDYRGLLRLMDTTSVDRYARTILIPFYSMTIRVENAVVVMGVFIRTSEAGWEQALILLPGFLSYTLLGKLEVTESKFVP